MKQYEYSREEVWSCDVELFEAGRPLRKTTTYVGMTNTQDESPTVMEGNMDEEHSSEMENVPQSCWVVPVDDTSDYPGMIEPWMHCTVEPTPYELRA